MTKEEIKKKIEELEKQAFYLDMKDHWNQADFDESRRLNTEIELLKKELAK